MIGSVVGRVVGMNLNVESDALRLQGRLDLDKFVSETIRLEDVEEAFHKMERGEVLRSVVVL